MRGDGGVCFWCTILSVPLVRHCPSEARGDVPRGCETPEGLLTENESRREEPCSRRGERRKVLHGNRLLLLMSKLMFERGERFFFIIYAQGLATTALR